MINVTEYLERFRQYLKENGIVKLDEPEDTEVCSYTTFRSDPKIDFDSVYWNSAMEAMIKSIKKHDFGCYYALDVAYGNNSWNYCTGNMDIGDDVIYIVSTRGATTMSPRAIRNSVNLENPIVFNWSKVMKHDFGQGPVAAHKHPNGGGWVADTANVDDSAYIGPDTQVFGNARILANVKICNIAKVYDTAIVYPNARVDGKTSIGGSSLIHHTTHIVLLDTDSFKCYGPFSAPGEMLLCPGVNYRVIELEKNDGL